MISIGIHFKFSETLIMSNEWIFYPRQTGESPESVFYDHGIREQIDVIAPSNFLFVELVMKHPREDGLSSNEEAETLYAFEDELETIAASADSLWVGRVTTEGRRYFTLFTAEGPDEWKPRIAGLAERHGYQLNFAIRPDPEREAYWEGLFPSEDDWRVVCDIQVISQLSKHGDDGSAPRQVDHWAYFAAKAQAEQFAVWLSAQGYEVTDVRPSSEEYGIEFKHEGSVELAEISSHTLALMHQAEELGGRYDGWATSVCVSPEGE